ncbi:ChrR family anti-sigma-E factor [Vibrio sagamiensis]|uniref:Transcriptional regulator n=1 Tax=Vibrio sagamiensis NBRC 104589 TaxID=1219064 RepID=A0A511Q9R0_9VIBR|nr:ChrR family anti-sigma-E factor [Vibrio sagamiensis]PNQ70205.1 transcriptional regulator [Vibrio agarivorans]GEM74031.1 transcriptional regulator [Vibrio sagamiensis NBRC 104589]
MNNHLDTHLLEAYASGEIDAVSGLFVATHLDICPECRSLVNQIEECKANHIAESSFGYTDDFEHMLDTIVSQPAVGDDFVLYDRRTINVADKEFLLPKSLYRFADLIGDWKNYGGRVFSAPIDLGEDQRVSLMYINENVKIPQHTHKGSETTLVLHGGFSDEKGHYEVGDIIVRDSQCTHSPFTQSGEDCLILAALTEPMLFTQGVAKIFNLFGKGVYP